MLSCKGGKNTNDENVRWIQNRCIGWPSPFVSCDNAVGGHGKNVPKTTALQEERTVFLAGPLKCCGIRETLSDPNMALTPLKSFRPFQPPHASLSSRSAPYPSYPLGHY